MRFIDPKVKARQDLKQYETKLIELSEERDRVYRGVQDFRVDHTTTNYAIKRLREINSEIKRTKTQVKKLKEKL